MAAGTDGQLFSEALLLLGSAVIAVPVFKKIGLGSVLGYLAAGAIIGPVLRLIADGEAILHVAELGIVLLLFIIGLELKPSRLWSLRVDIFGIGSSQIVAAGIVLALLAFAAGQTVGASIIIGFGLALSSTAIVMQILEERGSTGTPFGRKSFAILLMQDLAIVPLLALIPVFSPAPGEGGSVWLSLVLAIAAIVAVVVAGRFVLNPLFRILANAGAREIMTAAALFVVLGAAVLVGATGLSMAMGAFLAGVLLSESSYRHELEADIEPFRGLLLGLFFMAVGMSLDLSVVLRDWLVIVLAVPVLFAAKIATTYGAMRLFRVDHATALKTGFLVSQGGEFAFVLFTTASAAQVMSSDTASVLTAIVTISMALTPAVLLIARRFAPKPRSVEIEEDFEGAGGRVLMIGFGRFGQIAAQSLLLQGIDVTAIDADADMIRAAARFGFKVYFGDGTRLDVLRAAGIEQSQMVAICTDKAEVTDKVVDLIRSEYPLIKIHVRAYDRRHALKLLEKGVDYQMRETVESAFAFGAAALDGLGIAADRIAEISEMLRARDAELLVTQQAGGMITAGRDLIATSPVQPEPLTAPSRASRALNKEAEAATAEVEPAE